MQELCARTAQELLEEPIVEADWVIEDLLPVGAHILAGAPKIGKSWMVLAMGLAVSMGQPFWDYAVCQGAVLYLCLEDTYARVKKRLWRLTDEANDCFYLANSAATIKDGLAEQIEYFVITHPDLKLVFVNTFQKVRSPTGDSIYAADYSDFSALKAVADKHGLAMMVVHHTRKMADEDIMNTVSESSGITGSADSIWVLKRASRGVGDATLTITGRDVEFRELKLALRDCRWNLIERTSEEELEERDVPD
ncbi:MAG: AAA family ATPase, partial [Collinsella bouchesdurhonensis]|nr:AAA family ATPase [Collinsella bouchesdurhonensis]